MLRADKRLVTSASRRRACVWSSPAIRRREYFAALRSASMQRPKSIAIERGVDRIVVCERDGGRPIPMLDRRICAVQRCRVVLRLSNAIYRTLGDSSQRLRRLDARPDGTGYPTREQRREGDKRCDQFHWYATSLCCETSRPTCSSSSDTRSGTSTPTSLSIKNVAP